MKDEGGVKGGRVKEAPLWSAAPCRRFCTVHEVSQQITKAATRRRTPKRLF
jgi:hypothetical protein